MKSDSGKLIEKNDTSLTNFDNKLTKRKTLKFLFNKKEGTFCGRTCKSWGQIIIFYIVFYICLAAFWITCFAIFLKTLDENKPTFYEPGSIIGAIPGMSMLPYSSIETNVVPIIYNKTVKETYQNHVDVIQNFLNKYKNTNGTKECSSTKDNISDICRYDLSEFANCNIDNNFGYPEGKPCIILFLNKLLGFIPKALAENSENNTLANKIPFKCYNSTGKTNLEAQYMPKDGIDFKYFPYIFNKNYHRPFVMVKFTNLTTVSSAHSTGTFITCQALLNNLKDNQTETITVSLEMKIMA